MYAEHASTAARLGSVSRRYCQPIAFRTGRLTDRRPLVAPRHTLMLLGGEASEETPRGDGPAARTARLARLEAVLFLSQQPRGSRKLAELAGLADGTKARTLIRALNQRYDIQGSAFRVEEVAGGFQLMTRPEFAPWLRRLHNAAVEVRLSAPAMETLAVVAYRQPIVRAEIEAVRGVQCGEILRQLIERNLVRIAGRSEELGRPFLYGTTRQFLEVFGLRHLDELPRAERFQPGGDTLLPKKTDSVKANEDEADKEMMNQDNDSSESVEEANVNSTIMADTPLEELAEETLTGSTPPEANELPEDDLPLNDEQEEEDEEDEEDEGEGDEEEDDKDEEDDEEYEDDEDDEEEDEDEDEDEDEEYEDVDEDEEEDEDYEYEYEEDEDEDDEDDDDDDEEEDDLDEEVWEEVGDDDEDEDEDEEDVEDEEDEEEWEDDDEGEEEDDEDDEDSWYEEGKDEKK